MKKIIFLILLLIPVNAYAYKEVFNSHTGRLDKVGADSASDVSSSLCSDGQILKKSGGVWACGSDDSTAGGGTIRVSEDTVFVASADTLDFRTGIKATVASGSKLNVSADIATTTTPGIASFDTNVFSVRADGGVSTKALTGDVTTSAGSLDTAIGADAIDALTEIDQSIKTAADDTSKLVVGTAGSNGELAKWNTDGTLTDSNVIIGTVTDGKWCSYASSGTTISCTQDAPAGSGDVTGVGDCVGGDCLDGTSDGGTYIRLYDGDSNYGAIATANLSANRAYTLPNYDATIASLAGTETLTNKTLAAADNVIEADTGDSATSFFSTGTIEGARLGTFSKSFVITGATSAGDFGTVWRSPVAITITAVHCNAVGGTNVIGQLQECDSSGASCADVDSDITCTAGSNVNDDGSLTNPSIDAGDYLGVKTTSVSGTNTRITWTFEYTVN